MSDHTTPGGSGGSSDAIKDNRAGRVRNMAPPPRPVFAPPLQQGSDDAPKWQVLKPKPGFGREERQFFRRALQVDLPPPQEVQQEIRQQLVVDDPPQDPLPQREKSPPRRLVRRKDKIDLQQEVDKFWSGPRDQILQQWEDAKQAYTAAKALKKSEVGVPQARQALEQAVALAQAVIDAADDYHKMGTGLPEPGSGPPRGGKSKSPIAAMREDVSEVAGAARQLQKAVAGLLPDLDVAPDDIGTGLEARRRGVRFSDLKTDTYGDDKLDLQNSKEDFAGGQVNKVSKLVYGDETRIFKAEGLTTNSRANQISICGIDKNAPRFGNRNIATKAMSDVLGGSTIPDSCFTVHNGQVGLLMQMAPGQEMKDFKKTGFDPSPPPDDLVASLHSQLNELEWTDMLTGQGDRHDGNYMIDTKGGGVKISGIDNDFCFGKNQTSYDKYGSNPAEEGRGGRRGPFWGYNSSEKPALIDAKAFARLDGTEFDRDVRPRLAGLLSDEEIDASAQRFAEMQQHARSLSPDYVVADWKTWRSPAPEEQDRLPATEFLKAHPSISLFQRDFGKMI
jgi:hypothetical protein